MFVLYFFLYFLSSFVIVTLSLLFLLFFFFNDPATTEISPLSLHDALPISSTSRTAAAPCRRHGGCARPNNRWIARATNPDSPYRNRKAITPTNGGSTAGRAMTEPRSEEHTSELQSRSDLVCRLLLEKKKKIRKERKKINEISS